MTCWLRERGIDATHLLRTDALLCDAVLPAGTASAWAVAREPVGDMTAPYLGAWLCAERAMAIRLRQRLAMAADERGAPVRPESCTGSISHSRHKAWAMVALQRVSAGVGIDVESIVGARAVPEIAAICCTPKERTTWLTTGDRDVVLTLTLSTKECLYKAVEPWPRQSINFDEVQTTAFEPEHQRLSLQTRSGSALAGSFDGLTVRYRVETARASLVCAPSLSASPRVGLVARARWCTRVAVTADLTPKTTSASASRCSKTQGARSAFQTLTRDCRSRRYAQHDPLQHRQGALMRTHLSSGNEAREQSRFH